MTIADLTRRVTAVLAALFLVFALAACEEQDTMEQTGEAIDNTAENTVEMLEEGAVNPEESAEKVQESAQ